MSTIGGSRVALELDWPKVTVAVHDGIMLPVYDEPVSEHLAKVKDMEIRDDDVILCVYPRSGTHWLYRIVDMLIRGRAQYDIRTVASTFLDFQSVEKMAELDSPRILVTHLSPNYLPCQVKDKRTKIVHMYRNPKAVLSSFVIITKEGDWHPDLTSPDWTELFFSPKMSYGGWFYHLDKVAEFQRTNPDHPITSLSYEDMSRNPLDTVRQLAEFLGVRRTDDFYRDVVAACSFDKQKAIEERKESEKLSKFYRKGDVNDWKNHVTVAICERIDGILKERADRCPFSAKYIT